MGSLLGLALVFQFVGSLAVAASAVEKGRGGVGWFCASLVTHPILAAILLSGTPARIWKRTIFCAFCRTPHSDAATVCPACGRDVPPGGSPT